MSFVLMEDLKRPLPKRRYAFFYSFHLVRPLYKFVRNTYRGSRFLLQTAMQVIRRDKRQRTEESAPVQEVSRSSQR